MGSSCSSGQGHKDKDSVSTKSEESPAYQVIVKKSSDGDNKITAPQQQGNHSGVILEPKGLTAPASNATAQAKTGRNATSSVSADTTSLPSPPTLSPKECSEPPLPQELTQLPETYQNLIIGKVSDASLSFKTRKIVIYVCAADSQDCCVEKGVLHQVVVPELRSYCRDKGYELHITDLHWKTGLEKQQDHEFPELCLGELNRQMEVGYIIPVLFLSNSLGTPLLPKTVETQDFEMALSQAEDKDSLKKWYKLDSNAQPPCYRLQPVASHIPGFKENSWEMRERALEEWRSEIERTLTAMIKVFSEELRDTYLTTVVEQEVHNTILMSQELARRCLWLYRVFTQKPEPNTTASLLEQEQKRRLDIIYKDLKSQLTEKHVIRLSVKWNQGGIVDQNIPEHAQYVSDVTSHLMKYLKATIFNIIEEDQSKAVVRSMFGIESQFLNELKWQAMYCQKAAQSSVNREQVLQEIQSYLTGDSTTPVLIHGTKGSGKTTMLTRSIHCMSNWLPDSYAIFRFTLISELSYSLINIIKTVCDHLSLLAYGHHTFCDYDMTSYEKIFPELISAIAIQRPVVIVLDGLDRIEVPNLDWIPQSLPNNAKMIVSASTDSNLYNQFKAKFPSEECHKEIRDLSKTEAESLLLSSVTQYSHSVNSKTSQSFLSAMQHCTLPLYVKVLAWRASWFTQIDHNFEPKNNLNDEMDSVLDFIDAMLGADRVRIALSLIAVSKYGLRDSELLEMLSQESEFHSETTYLKWAPACLFLSRITKYLSPFLSWVSDGNNLALKVSNQSFNDIVIQRYVQRNPKYNQIIQQYFKGSLHTDNKSVNKYHKGCKKRAMIEAPYQAIMLKQEITDDYLLNHKWLFEKICACGVFQILDDLFSVKNNSSRLKDLEMLQKILERNHISLNYDGRQMYSKFYEELKNVQSPSSFWTRFQEETGHPPVNTLLPIMKESPRVGDSLEKTNIDKHNINLIVRLNENPNFVVSVSTEKEEIAVWDLYSCEKVRTIQGVTHPISLQLIDDYRAVVLCRRELRIYNLDDGVLLTKLKGVMNQKMAYFGLHDKNHLVALSRNRMYVNLMHLETGDCVATFKAGEDRFLNSLLVSGDGRILVCGDETQKPFPLLVWNLSSRKLLYDLRIPHHEFLTNLSAITHEGHYVCCVAKEVDEPGPNFIVVYDLQSGTLFKKWKPGVDTTSLDISSKDSCVISGLADARILVWDLVTGNCRWSLRGHSAPVTLVRRDPCGGSFMSADICNRDRSFRLWDLNKGELLAVYTPPDPFSACELGIGGKTISVSLKGEENVRTLILKGPGIEERNANSSYGKAENHGKVFNLSENQNAR
ncbi:UNVERIFIED_CONTAM: hypothetical protein PYX00_004199 [Menopon gallinae]|uniref:NACHT and WD repeat domain-containing protein 2 n=1 Tax=Menopon gallinae TaxID=328185 RepID=A0AAW2I4E1_9NEOP